MAQMRGQRGKRHGFLHGALVLTAGMAVVKVLGALFKVPLTYAIGEYGIGLFNLAYHFYGPVFTLATAGFPLAVAQLVSESSSLGRWNDARQVKQVAMPLFLGVGALGLGAMACLAPLYCRWVTGAAYALAPMIALAPAVLLACAASVYRGYYEGLGNMVPTAFSQVLEAAVKLALGLAAAWWAVAFFQGEYAARGFTMQLHLGALRNLNTLRFRGLGPDVGCDSIGDGIPAASLAALLDRLAVRDALPKSILYTLNASDNEKLIAAAGCFHDGATAGKVQFGSAWWFNDHLDGMEKQLRDLANIGVLSRFVGMLTDSRSFLSYPRHEYFRRILCRVIGGWVADGQAPADYELLGAMVQDICFHNVANFIGIQG